MMERRNSLSDSATLSTLSVVIVCREKLIRSARLCQFELSAHRHDNSAGRSDESGFIGHVQLDTGPGGFTRFAVVCQISEPCVFVAFKRRLWMASDVTDHIRT